MTIEAKPETLLIPETKSWRDVYTTSKDGLRLYARDYGSRVNAAIPVVCLPGFTRNSKDFHQLAEHLRQKRRVLCLDYRGRGRSQYDRNHKNYNPVIEASDALDVMTAVGIGHAIFIGTSRGGILAMIMAVMRPSVLKGVVLNDIGAEIAVEGLLRISGYVGTMPDPKNWNEAAITLNKMSQAHFPNLEEEEWMTFARNTFHDDNGLPKIDCDPGLRDTMPKIIASDDAEIPKFWPQFNALKNVPMLVVRGENSDILTKETLAKMHEAHEKMASITLKDRGHAPFLTEPEAVEAIDDLIARVERSQRISGRS